MKIPLSKGIPEHQIAEAVSAVLCIPNVRRGTAFLSENFTVKATAQRKIGKADRSATLLLTVGAPNFLERRFIRLCKKAGMVFPLRHIQLKFWTPKKHKP